jgi:iron complex outermembrane receptor protein
MPKGARLATPRTASLTGGLLALGLHLGAPGAEPSAPTLGEVVVTAERRPELLQDVPIAITVLSATSIRELGLSSSSDLAHFTPNLTWAPSGGVGSNIGMRGVVDVNFTTSQVGSVGIIVDEVAMNSPVLNTFALFDLDRVEVLRGPQVTLYGRSTTGGAINFITHRPEVSEGTNGRATITAGNFGEWDLDGAVGFAVGERTAIRIAATSQNRNGIFLNRTLGTRDSDIERRAARVAVSSGFADSGSLFATAFAGSSGGQSLRYKSIGLLRPQTSPTVFCARPSLGSGCVDIEGFSDTRDFNEVYADYPNPIEDINVRGASLNVGWHFGPVDVNSISAWVHNSIARSEDTDGGPYPIADVHIDAGTDQYSQEFRLTSTDNHARVRWLAGALYSQETQRGASSALRRLSSVITPPVAFSALGFDQLDQIYSAYGQVDFKVTDLWSITLGGRYSSERKDGTAERMRSFPFDTSRFPPVGTHVDLALARQIGDPAFDRIIPFGKTWDNSGGKLGLNFNPYNGVLVFATVSRGFKGGTFNFAGASMFRGAPGAPAAGEAAFRHGVDPENLTTYEIGAKTRFHEDRAELNVALFYNNYRNQQVFGFDANGNLVLRNAASSRATGAEAELKWLAMDTFLIQLGTGYIDGHYRHFVLDDSVSPALVADGNRMILTPVVTANALLRKSWQVLIGEVSLLVEASYVGGQYFEPDNPPQTFEPAHTTVDARMAYVFGRSAAYELTLFGRNIGDKRFCLNAGTLPIGVATCSPNDPRTYGLAMSAHF